MIDYKPITEIGPLGFIMPAVSQHGQTSETIESIIKWKTSIGLADLGKSAKALFEKLIDLNQSQMPPLLRLDILNELQTTVNHLANALGKHFLNQLAVLPAKKWLIVELAHALEENMALGYKLVFEQLSQVEGNLSKELQGQLLHNILQFSVKILIRTYHLHCAPAKDLWQQCHLVYQMAKKYNVTSHKNSSNLFKAGLSLEMIYKSTLLLSIIDPYRWRMNEYNNLCQQLGDWQALIKLTKTNKFGEQFTFVFDCQQDMSPVASHLNLVEPSEFTYLINIEDLLKKIKDELQVFSKAKTALKNEQTQKQYIYECLVHIWRANVGRERVRNPLDAKFEICLGLSAIHHYLSLEQAFPPIKKEAPSGLGFNIQNNTENEEETETIDFNSAFNVNKNSKASFKLYTCSVENNQAYGYCLILNSDLLPFIQVGELIGIHKSNHYGIDWECGVIRWFKRIDSNLLKFGIEILAENAEAIAAQQILEDGSHGNFQRCLIIDSKDPSKQSIISSTVSLNLKQSALVDIHLANFEIQKIKLSNLLKLTNTYKQHQFVLADQALPKAIPVTPVKREEPIIAAENPNLKSAYFDSIWQKL